MVKSAESHSAAPRRCQNPPLYLSVPPLLDVLVVGAFLQPPGLSLLRGGVIAVVVQEERPDLPADGRVDPAEENGLSERKRKRERGNRLMQVSFLWFCNRLQN